MRSGVYTMPTTSLKAVLLFQIVLQMCTVGVVSVSVNCNKGTVGSPITITEQPASIEGCSVEGDIRVDVNSLVLSTAAPIVVSINASTFLPMVRLWVDGFASVSSALAVTHPLLLTVTYNNISDGLIVFSDAFPPGSILNVLHNDISQFNAVPPVALDCVVCTELFGLYGSSQLLVSHNTIVVDRLHSTSPPQSITELTTIVYSRSPITM